MIFAPGSSVFLSAATLITAWSSSHRTSRFLSYVMPTPEPLMFPFVKSTFFGARTTSSPLL